MQKYTLDELKATGIHNLRNILRDMGGVPGTEKKAELIRQITAIQNQEAVPQRTNRGRKPLDFKHVTQSGSSENFKGVAFMQDEELARAFSAGAAANGESVLIGDPIVCGVYESCPDGYGFLRVHNYDNSPKDAFVSPVLVKKFNLRDGDFIKGQSKKNDGNKAAAISEIFTLNGEVPVENSRRIEFDDLIPHYPTERYTLSEGYAQNDYSIRCLDLFAPIGKGQRGLIVAPPKAGKTTLLKKIANSICANYPATHLITLLIDERPEEVTDIRESVGGEVVSSTFDESVEHHVKLAELALNRAKRLVENGKDVFILLDSITKLARAYNAIAPSSGKTLTGGIDISALQSPKKFFGAARNIVNGGSLTIIATALIDTGSKMDEVIYEEFKGTGNMEIHLSRELSERRIFPAIDLFRSGTRKDELLLSGEELNCVNRIRRLLQNDKRASESMLDMMAKTADNEDFVQRVPEWLKMVSPNRP